MNTRRIKDGRTFNAESPPDIIPDLLRGLLEGLKKGNGLFVSDALRQPDGVTVAI